MPNYEVPRPISFSSSETSKDFVGVVGPEVLSPVLLFLFAIYWRMDRWVVGVMLRERQARAPSLEVLNNTTTIKTYHRYRY